MRTFLLSALLLPAVAVAQTGDFTFVHGLPGLTGSVDVAVNGNAVFNGVNFGELESTPLAPGSYTVDVIGGGSVLLSSTVTIAADESVSVAAFPLTGGTPTLSVFEQDLSAVSIAGNGRITLRFLADAQFAFIGARGPTTYNLTFLTNGDSLPIESEPGDYQVEAQEVSPTSPPAFPFPPSALIASSLTLAADAGLEIYIVGTGNNMSVITQDLTLAPATVVVPGACDLTLSGTLVGGSLTAGGTVTYDLTGAGPDSFVAIFLGLDATPLNFFNIPLGIGGSGGLGVVDFGVADSNGNYSFTQVYAPTTINNPLGGPIVPSTIDFVIQAASVDFVPGGALPTCISDIETLTINVP